MDEGSLDLRTDKTRGRVLKEDLSLREADLFQAPPTRTTRLVSLATRKPVPFDGI
jgi:hypothetical protein